MAGGSFLGSNKLTLDNNVFVNINCFFDGNAEIKLEECVRVGPYVRILTCSHTINAGVLRRFGNSSQIIAPVTVKKGSWLGIGVTILPGVTIEEGCVIAANSLVIHSTTPNGLYGGTPAVRIKDLPF
jgi:maltose O-acetyltransferase